MAPLIPILGVTAAAAAAGLWYLHSHQTATPAAPPGLPPPPPPPSGGGPTTVPTGGDTGYGSSYGGSPPTSYGGGYGSSGSDVSPPPSGGDQTAPSTPADTSGNPWWDPFGVSGYTAQSASQQTSGYFPGVPQHDTIDYPSYYGYIGGPTDHTMVGGEGLLYRELSGGWEDPIGEMAGAAASAAMTGAHHAPGADRMQRAGSGMQPAPRGIKPVGNRMQHAQPGGQYMQHAAVHARREHLLAKQAVIAAMGGVGV